MAFDEIQSNLIFKQLKYTKKEFGNQFFFSNWTAISLKHSIFKLLKYKINIYLFLHFIYFWFLFEINILFINADRISGIKT